MQSHKHVGKMALHLGIWVKSDTYSWSLIIENFWISLERIPTALHLSLLLHAWTQVWWLSVQCLHVCDTLCMCVLQPANSLVWDSYKYPVSSSTIKSLARWAEVTKECKQSGCCTFITEWFRFVSVVLGPQHCRLIQHLNKETHKDQFASCSSSDIPCAYI